MNNYKSFFNWCESKNINVEFNNLELEEVEEFEIWRDMYEDLSQKSNIQMHDFEILSSFLPKRFEFVNNIIIDRDFIDNNFLGDLKWYQKENLRNKLIDLSINRFVFKFMSQITSSLIVCRTVLSNELMREFQDSMAWNYISVYQKLSEDFIREFQDKVDWLSISMNQKLSEEFIREFQDKVYWDYISQYQALSEEFRKEFRGRINEA